MNEKRVCSGDKEVSFWTSDLQNRKMIHLCLLKPVKLWSYVTVATGAHAGQVDQVGGASSLRGRWRRKGRLGFGARPRGLRDRVAVTPVFGSSRWQEGLEARSEGLYSLFCTDDVFILVTSLLRTASRDV